MAEFKDRLNYALEEKGLKAADLSKMTGIGEGAISQYRSGAYKASQRNLELIANALNVSIPWLMGVSDNSAVKMPGNLIPMPEMDFVPLIGDIACGRPIIAVEESEERAPKPDFVHADFALHCKGDSMINARIFDGDLVYIRRQPQVENGQIAAVCIGDEVTLKRVYQSPGRLILRAANPLYEDMVFMGDELEDIQILGLAVAFTSVIK